MWAEYVLGLFTGIGIGAVAVALLVHAAIRRDTLIIRVKPEEAKGDSQ